MIKLKDLLNESASRTAMEIGGYTGLNKNAVQKFVDDNNLDIEKLFQYVKKGKLPQRMELVSAIAGRPNNPIQKKMIKMFAESVNEAIKGRNSKTGETFGMVVGSDKQGDDGYEVTIRVSYSSRISAYKFVFDKDSNLVKIHDYGYSKDGKFPDMAGSSSVTSIRPDKRETITQIAKVSSPAFAKKIYQHVLKNNKVDESVNEVSGEFVVFVEKDNGRKKLLHTKKSQRAANMFLTKNVDKILNQSGVRSIGSMSKDQWEKTEAQYAENIKKVGMKTVTKKEWDKAHKDYKGMIKGQPYMMYMDKKGVTVYGPVTIEESINEANYQVYHKSFTDAANTAREMAEKRGFEIDEDDWQTQVALGGKNKRSRPSVGKETRFTVGLIKNGKPQRKALNFQVYGMKNGYELNAYIN